MEEIVKLNERQKKRYKIILLIPPLLVIVLMFGLIALSLVHDIRNGRALRGAINDYLTDFAWGMILVYPLLFLAYPFVSFFIILCTPLNKILAHKEGYTLLSAIDIVYLIYFFF